MAQASIYSKHAAQIASVKHADEERLVQSLLSQAELSQVQMQRVQQQALLLAQSLRTTAQQGSEIQNLLQEFALSTEEGVVLMCLAEALLRVPDRLTADRLIRDKLAIGDWESHLGQDDSLFVNASAWGLFLSGKLSGFSKAQLHLGLGGLKKILATLGEPVIRTAMRQAMRVMGSQFVLGTDIENAFKRGENEESQGFRYSYDMLGEAARTDAAASDYFTAYANAITAIAARTQGRGPVAEAGISVKLSALHPRYEFAQYDRVMAELKPRLLQLAQMAKAANIGFTVDAEEADRLDISLALIEAVFLDESLAGWDGFGLALQAYQKRAPKVLEYLIDLCRTRQRKMMLRLVKGAYWDSEIKHAQLEGLADYPVFTRKQSTDVSYQVCARMLLQARDVIYPQFATHNALSVAYVLEAAADNKGFEFQRLHGMGEGLYEGLLKERGIPCRIYAPVGEHRDLLAYLVRRLLENGANSSFVNNIVDDEVSLESLLESPVDYLRRQSSLRHPGIALPATIYPNERINSAGLDLSHKPDREAIEQALADLQARLPLMKAAETAQSVYNPATGELLGSWSVSKASDIDNALLQAELAQAAWGGRNAQSRAACLLKLADALQQALPQFVALLMLEAGKTRADAIAEVREAIDFCRYYAERGMQLDPLASPLGVVLCISPWNFPLAIFLGQIVAALMAGNTVLAKPAEQTSMVAMQVIALFEHCGFDTHAVQLLLGPGAPIGQRLLPHAAIAAVMFTGSTATAQLIADTLAQRDGVRVPLIAETGGQNCMLVDSSALPEQLLDDVINSAFRSAGQRCSALRVLYLQEEIADNVIAMIKGAMQELQVGDPCDLACDVGPVIDAKALAGLQAHITGMQREARSVYSLAIAESNGHYCAPQLIEIDSIAQLKSEVFGPVLHVVRYRANELDKVYEAINSTGFGLTAGIHSRIENSANAFAANINAGNIYVNRNTIGAVVGVQPFGGRALSGTGPKAGGPNYLTRLVSWPQVSMAAATVPLQFECKLEGRIMPADQWLQMSFARRLTHLGPLLAQLQTAMAIDGADLIAAFEHIVQNFNWRASRLQGPTGEENVLLYEPRGRVLCLSEKAPGPAWYFHALCNLLAGNILLLPKHNDVTAYLQTLTVLGLQSRVRSIDYDDALLREESAVQAVCASGSDEYICQLDRQLRQRKGAMVPLISDLSLTTVMPRLLLEKVISTDTTAAGGNASLLVME